MTAQSRPTVSAVSAELIRAALTYVERNEAKNIQVEDLVNAVQVEYRTLLRAFKRHLEVTPKRYLKLRQLNLVRCALRAPEGSSAIEIMADFGVTEFGRFASDYKRLFDELPSETLRRAITGNLEVSDFACPLDIDRVKLTIGAPAYASQSTEELAEAAKNPGMRTNV